MCLSQVWAVYIVEGAIKFEEKGTFTWREHNHLGKSSGAQKQLAVVDRDSVYYLTEIYEEFACVDKTFLQKKTEVLNSKEEIEKKNNPKNTNKTEGIFPENKKPDIQILC